MINVYLLNVGAIYKYNRESESVLLRETLPSNDDFELTRSLVRMTGVDPPEDWKGNPDWSEFIWHPTKYYEYLNARELDDSKTMSCKK